VWSRLLHSPSFYLALLLIVVSVSVKDVVCATWRRYVWGYTSSQILQEVGNKLLMTLFYYVSVSFLCELDVRCGCQRKIISNFYLKFSISVQISLREAYLSQTTKHHHHHRNTEIRDDVSIQVGG
jgi:hypothetical protein